MKKIDIDNQDLGALLIGAIAIATIFNFETLHGLDRGLPGQLINTAMVALIAWIRPSGK